jgi:hypothetical protein
MLENTIIIPYRDRKKHLEYFINHTVPLIQKHLLHTKIIVVEQANDKLFNRGKLLNVGFMEYKDKTTYFFTHDVDINPTEDVLKEYYTYNVPSKKVWGIYTSAFNTLGGIIKIRSEDIFMANGFPNNIWGWGAEDKALQNRTEFFDIVKIVNFTPKTHGAELKFKRFDDVKDRVTINHSKNHQYNYIEFVKFSKEKKKTEIFKSGLNNIDYRILSTEKISDMVEIIKVDI